MIKLNETQTNSIKTAISQLLEVGIDILIGMFKPEEIEKRKRNRQHRHGKTKNKLDTESNTIS